MDRVHFHSCFISKPLATHPPNEWYESDILSRYANHEHLIKLTANHIVSFLIYDSI